MKRLLLIASLLISFASFAKKPDHSIYLLGGTAYVDGYANSYSNVFKTFNTAVPLIGKVGYEYRFNKFHVGGSFAIGNYLNRQKVNLTNLNGENLGEVNAKFYWGKPGFTFNVNGGLNIGSGSLGASFGYALLTAHSSYGLISPDYTKFLFGRSEGINIGIYYRYFHWFRKIGVGGEVNPNIMLTHTEGYIHTKYTVIAFPVLLGLSYKL